MVQKKKKKASKERTSRAIFYIVMIALPLLQVFLFYFCVNFNSILLAFQGQVNEAWQFVGFDNFRKVLFDIFHDVKWGYAFKNSLIVYFVTTAANIVLSLLFSYYIYKKRAGSKAFKVFLYMPSIISSMVMVILFRYFVDTFIPDLVLTLSHKQIDGLLSNPKLTMTMLMLYAIITGFGTNVLLLSGSMGSVNESLIEAAQLDGASEISQFFHVVLPHIWPTLVTLIVTGMAGMFTNQFNLFSLYSRNAEPQHATVGYLLFTLTSKASEAEYPYLAAFGICLTIVIIPLTLGIRKLLTKVGPSDD